MNETQDHQFYELVTLQRKLTEDTLDYWQSYSSFITWQFWVVVSLLILPLILLFLKIDRANIFQIGFFGFATHVLFNYIDIFGIRFGLWGYPYQMIPFLPSFSLDASIIPVVIMLVYQWTMKTQRNYYLYASLTAVIFGFIFKPILVAIGLFEKYQWVNYVYIFFIYILLFFLAYWITTFFSSMKKKKSS